MTKDDIKSVQKVNSPVSGKLSNYKTITNNDIVFFVPHATDNSDYQAIQDWVADGNTIAEAD
jgi:hypothetical protein